MKSRVPGAVTRAAAVALAVVALASPALAVTKTWTNNNGSGDGRWLTAANWSPSGVPTASDDVEIGVTDQASNYCIIDGGAVANSVTVGNVFTNNPTLEVKSGATLTITAASSVDSGSTLYLNNGNLAGTGALTLSGTMNVAGGTIGGSGGMTIASLAAVNFTGTVNSCYLSRNVTNNGTISYASTTNFYYLYTSAVITNNGTVDFAADEDLWTSGAGPFRIDNQSGGTVKKSAGTGTSAIKCAVNNATGAFVKSDSGTLTLDGGGTSTGAFTIAAGNTIGVSTTNYNLGAGATVSGSGKIAAAGTLTIPSGADVTIPNLQLVNGSARIEGTGTLRIGTFLQWDGGYMAGGGLSVLQGTATAAINCSTNYCYLDNRTFNLGTGSSTTYTPATYALYLYNGAALNVNSGATLDIQTDQDIYNGGGSPAPSMSNAGTIQKTSGAGAFLFYVPLTSTGAFTLVSGDMQFPASTTINGGSVSIGTTSNFDVTGSVFNVSSAFTVSGTGNFRVTGGTLRIPTGVTQLIPRFSLTGSSAVVDGAGTLQLSGTNTWSGGYMGSTGSSGGTTEVVSGAILNISGASYYTYLEGGRQLLNNGTVNYSSPTYALYCYNGSDIVNNSTFDLQSDLGIYISGSGSLFTNNATLLKSAGTSATGAPIYIELDNAAAGNVNVMSGRLNLAGKGTGSGTFTIAAGSFIQVTSDYDFSGTPAIAGTGTLRVNGGNLIVPSGVTLAVPNLQFDSGYISGAGTVQITGTGTWAAGTMGHPTYPGGTTQVGVSATLDINPTTYVYLDQSRSLVNNNIINYTAATYGLWIYNSSSLTNAGTFNYDSDVGIGVGGSGSLITNSGTILKDSGTGSPIINVPLNNTGLIQVDTGTLFLGANGTHTGGDFTGNGSAAAGFSGGTHTLDATSTLSGTGGITVTGGTVNVAGSYDPARLTVSGGTINLNSNGTADVLTLTNSGILAGSGTFTILSTSTWTGGTMQGTGTTILDAGQTLTISGTTNYPFVAESRTFTNNGTVDYTATTSNYHLYLYQNAVWNNAGTFNITDNQQVYGSTITAFNNSGTVQKSGGTGTTTFSTTFNNTGTVTVTTGTLAFNGNGTHTGSFTATSPGTIAFGGGTQTMSTPGTLGGTGTLAFTGASVTSGIGYTVGTLKVTGGTVTMNGSGSADALDMSAGTLGGSGTLTLNNGGTWSGGTMSGTGSTVLPSGKTLAINVSTSYPTLDTRTFTNNGTVNYTNTSYAYLQIYSSATFANAGAFNLAGDQGIYGFSSGTFNNSGTFTRVSGTANAVISPIFNNTGALTVSTGTLSFSGNGTHTGSFSIASGATLAFSGGTHTATAGSITGSGTLAFTGAAATFGISYTVGALTVSAGTATLNGNGSADAFTMSNGTLAGSGTLTLNNGGTWSGGTMSGTGTTLNPATKTLNITAAVTYCTLDTRTLTNNGILNYAPASSPYLQIYNSGTLNNTGAMNLTAGTYVYGASSGTLNNSGTLTKSGAAQLDFGPILNNSGQVTATAGTLSLNGGGTHTNGVFTATSPATLQFGGGTHTLAGSGSMGGTGSWSVTSGTVNVGVPYSLVSLALSNGRIDFNTSGSIGTLAQSSGTLGGTGTVSVSDNSTWTGGATDGTGNTVFAAAKTVTLGGSNYLSIDTRTVTANGTMNYVAPTYQLQIYNNGILDITATGVLNIQTDVILYGYSGGTINNDGTINRTSGSSNTTDIYPVVNNDGAINVTVGGLRFRGNGTHNGAWTATSPGLFEFQSGTNTFNASSTLGGTGKFRFVGGTHTINGTWGMPIDLTGATLNVNTNGSASALNQTGGTLAGSGNITVTGDSTLGGGMLTGTGTLTYDTGVIVSMPGNSYVTLERSVLNKGTINYTAPAYYLQLNGVTLTNDGTFDVQTDLTIYGYGASPTFQNNGTFKKTSGNATMQFWPSFSNDGLAQFASGTTYFSNTYVQGSGTTELINGATLQNTLVDINGGSLIGTGTVQGGVTSDGIVAPGASAGSLTITGNYIQTANADLNIELGGLTAGTQYDRLVVQGSVTLDGDLNISTINSFLPASGNTFQILTFGSRNPANTDFANKNGLSLGSGTNLIPAYSATDLQLTTNTVQADMQIAMSASAATVNNGDSFSYNVTVTNNGGSNASGVQVAATLPASVAFTGSSPAICTGAPNLVCSFGNVANLGNASVTINVTAVGSGSAPVSATVSASQFDPNGANNTANASVAITANANLSVTVTANMDPVAAGASAGFSIMVTNNGPDTANSVTLSTTPSAELTFNSATSPCGGGFPCSLGTMSPGATQTIATSWTVSPSASGTASLGAGVSAASPTDLNAADNTATDSFTIAQNADVQVAKSGPANVPPESGSTVTYSIAVTNNGPSNATAVSLDDPTPSGLTLQSVTGDCAAFPCAIGTMTVGQTKNVTVVYQISGAVGTTFTNTATVTSGADSNSANDSSSVVTTISNCPNVTITAPPSVNGNSTGNAASVTAVAGASYNWSIGNGVITSGAGTSSITFTAGSGGNVTLNVTVTSGACTSTPSATVPIISADVLVTKTGPANVSPTTGNSVTYTINVSNNGPSAANSVTLTDPTPAGMTFVSATGACASFPCSLGTLAASASASVQATYGFTGSGSSQVFTNTASVSSSTADSNGSNNSSSITTTVAACPSIVISGPSVMEPNTGSSATATPIGGATYAWSITNGTIDGGQGTNSITFTAGSIGTTTLSLTVTAGACTGNATLNITVASTQADVYVTKSAPSSVASGAQFVYTLTVGNNGPASGEDVSVSDTLPASLSFVSVDNPACSGGATVTCNFGILAAGAEQTVSITVDAPAGPASVTNTAQVTTTSADPVNVNNTSTATTSISAPVVQCPASAPSLIAPSDGAANVSSPVTFSWGSVANAQYYELWVGPNAGSLALQTTTGGTSANVSLGSGSYAWQVVAGGAQSCNTQPSVIRTFTIPAVVQCPTTAPALTAPADGAALTGTSVSFSWGAVANATSYELWLGENGGSLALATTTAGTSTTLSLNAGSTYAWQVIAKGDPSCSPQSSAIRTFSITPAVQCPATAPTLTGPADGASFGNTTVTFSWSAVANATSYELWIGPNAGSLALNTATGSTSVTLNLATGGYAWQVIAKGDPSCNPMPSAVFTFTITPTVQCPATAPALSAPADASTLNTTSVTFSWTTVADAMSYELWIGPDANSLALNTTTAGTSATVSLAAGTYAWKVIANGAQSCNAMPSAIRTFSIVLCPAAAPSLGGPADGASFSNNSVTFSWGAVANATSYELWLGPNAGSLALAATTASTSATLVLQAGATYTWQVVATGAASCTAQPSSTRSFFIEPVILPPPCPAAPSLIAPADGADNLTSPVTFSWANAGSDTTYDLLLRHDGGLFVTEATTTDTAVTLDLASGAYEWQVVARRSTCQPRPSSTRSFTIPQLNTCGSNAAPTGLSPANGETVSSPVTFSWNGAAGAIGYVVRMRVNGGALQDVGSTTGATSLTANVEPGAILWVVDALFAGCPSVRSAEASFNVSQPAACQGTATPASPANGISTTNAVIDFQWSAVAGASGYRVWLQTGTAAPEVIGETLGTSLTKTLAVGTHSWWVQTLFEGCPARESAHLTFTILPAQNCDGRGRPALDAPANGATTSSPNVTFTWSAVTNAIEYELWLAPAGGVPTLIGTTAVTSMTAEVAPGAIEWFVRAVFNGCPSTESDHRLLTYEPPANCAANERPVLIAPSEGERLAAPLSFDWNDVAGATGYDLFIDDQLVASTNASQAGGINHPLGAARWFVRAKFAQPCAALDSTESRFVVVPQVAACSPLDAPVISAPGQISSGVQARVQWSFVPGATMYVLQMANEPGFAAPATINTDAARQHSFELQNNTNDLIAVYVRVQAQDSRCNPIGVGPWSDTAIVYILPETGHDASAVIGEPAAVEYALPLGSEFAGQTFTATPTTSWITVTPSTGTVPAGGMTLTVTANTAGLPPGTNIGGITITTADAGRIRTSGTTTVTTPISVSLVSPVTPTPKSTPPPDALIIPAVANADGINSHFQSDVRVSNTSAQVMKYQLSFIPTGDAGISAGRQTTFSIEPGRTVALDDILKSWFGTGTTNAIGTLEVRPLTEVQKSTSSSPFGALPNIVTFASSRTFNVTSNGTFGQYIPAIPFANFIGEAAGALSLQQIAHSEQYRTNLGIVEGSGEGASLLIKVFNSDGSKLTEFPLTLKGGQHTQLNGFLTEHGVTSLSDGRVEVQVVDGNGKVTAYASVLDNATADPLLVSPVTLGNAGNTRWVMPGVADLNNGTANWQTDMRIFNAGTTSEELTLSFYSMNGGDPKTTTLTMAAGEVKQLDRVLANTFGVTQNGGAVHVTSADEARLIATARTYNQTTHGTYGQFISAVTPLEAVGVGSRPLQLLQVEESSRYRSNIGLAEVSGKPVTLEVSIVPPDVKFTATVRVDLAANQFLQIPSMLAGLGIGEIYNARVTVRAIGGEGRATAYASVIDAKTNDPTYVPAQ